MKSTLQIVEYSLPIFVRPALRPRRPTRPGQSGAKFAIVRIGPRWVRRPASTWWLYCQTASATMSGASAGMFLNTSRPMRWLLMNPCPVAGSTGFARSTDHPSVPSAAAMSLSSCCCVGQPAVFAEGRRSPLEMSQAVFGRTAAAVRSAGRVYVIVVLLRR